MIVDVSWNGKKVLIVGAGKQGKKRRRFSKRKALTSGRGSRL